MRYTLLLLPMLSLCACWKPSDRYRQNQTVYNTTIPKVWGSKPVYISDAEAKKILYDPQKHSIARPGNIYAFGNFIFQVDAGRGIHVIDNTHPSLADRIGFITLNGCEQISIKGNYLYANNYADLVTLDIANPTQLHLVGRVINAFPEFTYNYPLAQPEESGYFICPRSDSMVVGWVRDSIYINTCYKN